MSKTITVNAVDSTALIRLDSQVWVEVAYGGEVGIGGFDYDDTAGTGDVPAHKAITVEESESTPTRLYTGYIGGRGVSRGVLPKVSGQRQWDAQVLDLNTVLDDEVFTGSGANRPEETDYARVSWLLTTDAMSDLGITAGPIPNTNTATLDATDYRGYSPRRVLDDCAEAAAKNYFVYDWGSGYKLYYDKHTGTSLTSTLKLSSVLADVDSSTVYALEEPRMELDPSRIYSKVRFEYASGAVTVTNAATETAFRRREVGVLDTSVKSSTKATNKANKYLTLASTEKETFTCAVSLPADKVNLIRAGHRIEIKCPHLGINAFEFFRITRREVMPQQGGSGSSDVRYTLRLEFAEDVAFGNFGGGTNGGQGRGDPEDKVEVIPDVVACQTEGSSLVFGSPGNLERGEGDININKTGSGWGTNIAHGSTPCGVGPGAWTTSGDQEVSWETTAPADDSYLGIEVTTTMDTTEGDPQGYYISVSTSALTAFGQGIRVSGRLETAATVLIPRNLISWGNPLLIITSPAWSVPSPGFACGSSFSTPVVSGEGGSGQYGISLEAHTVKFCSPANGAAGWVGGSGLIDGSNRTFTLISWKGTGPVEATVNGLEVDGLTLDRTAKTVTFPSAPPPNSVVLFNYIVDAA